MLPLFRRILDWIYAIYVSQFHIVLCMNNYVFRWQKIKINEKNVENIEDRCRNVDTCKVYWYKKTIHSLELSVYMLFYYWKLWIVLQQLLMKFVFALNSRSAYRFMQKVVGMQGKFERSPISCS